MNILEIYEHIKALQGAFTNKDANSVYLKVAITEPILLACIDGASLSEIHQSVQKTIPTTERVIRNIYSI